MGRDDQHKPQEIQAVSEAIIQASMVLSQGKSKLLTHLEIQDLRNTIQARDREVATVTQNNIALTQRLAAFQAFLAQNNITIPAEYLGQAEAPLDIEHSQYRDRDMTEMEGDDSYNQ